MVRQVRALLLIQVILNQGSKVEAGLVTKPVHTRQLILRFLDFLELD